MGASRSVLFERLSAMSYDRRTEQRKSPSLDRLLATADGAMIDLHGWTEVDADRGVIAAARRRSIRATRWLAVTVLTSTGKPMIEFFFDCSSPWTYLAFHNIQPLAKELGVAISWRPILVGGIFNTVNPSVYASRETPVPLKARYMKKDLADWARSAGLAIKMPPTVFPVNSVKAMRGCIWLGKDMVPFARAVFEAYWGGDKDISQDSVLTEVCKSVGIDHVELFAGIGEQAIKDQLKANTDEVMARGGFGSPTIFVDKTDMYFGNDRMPLIREAVLRLKEKAA
jgi:2-hydroxychromene-2-carboxylate isomerase